MAERRALDIAHDLFRRPLMARLVQAAPLPPGMLEVIKIAAGEAPAREGLLLPDSQTAETTRQAAVFFLQQALFQEAGDDFRVLGLGRGATPEQIREHKRWLLKWLHPDRNPSKWESQLFLRVARAAETLEKRGDAGGAGAASDGAAGAEPAAAPGGAALNGPPRRDRPGTGRPPVHHRSHAGVALRPDVRSRRAGRVRPAQRRTVRRVSVAAGLALLAVAVWRLGEGTAWRAVLEHVMHEPMNWLALARG